jgi:hypothetical protein
MRITFRFVPIFALALTACSVEPRVSPAATGNISQPGDISEEQFAAVEKVLAENGTRIERVPSSYRGQAVHVYPPASAVASMTKTQAETIAAMVKSRLGKNATVYVKGPGGNTIGKY